MREASLKRETQETKVSVSLNLDGNGKGKIDTGIGFFDHMLELFKRFSGYDLEIIARGDNADNHHVVEDTGIVLGEVLRRALGKKEGIHRYGLAFTPMDEALSRIVIDLSGRAYLVYDVKLDREFIGELETELIEEFFTAFTFNSKMNLHIKSEYGRNNHHIVEAIFKGLGRALKEATEIVDSEGKIPSTKGTLE